jgi:hypothetical protein
MLFARFIEHTSMEICYRLWIEDNQVKSSSFIPPIEIVRKMVLKFCAWLGTIRAIRARSSCRETKASLGQAGHSFISTNSQRPSVLLCCFRIVRIYSTSSGQLLRATLAQARSLFDLTGVGTFFLLSFAPRSGRRLPWRKAPIWRLLRSENSQRHL